MRKSLTVTLLENDDSWGEIDSKSNDIKPDLDALEMSEMCPIPLPEKLPSLPDEHLRTSSTTTYMEVNGKHKTMRLLTGALGGNWPTFRRRADSACQTLSTTHCWYTLCDTIGIFLYISNIAITLYFFFLFLLVFVEVVHANLHNSQLFSGIAYLMGMFALILQTFSIGIGSYLLRSRFAKVEDDKVNGSFLRNLNSVALPAALFCALNLVGDLTFIIWVSTKFERNLVLNLFFFYGSYLSLVPTFLLTFQVWIVMADSAACSEILDSLVGHAKEDSLTWKIFKAERNRIVNVQTGNFWLTGLVIVTAVINTIAIVLELYGAAAGYYAYATSAAFEYIGFATLNFFLREPLALILILPGIMLINVKGNKLRQIFIDRDPYAFEIDEVGRIAPGGGSEMNDDEHASLMLDMRRMVRVLELEQLSGRVLAQPIEYRLLGCIKVDSSAVYGFALFIASTTLGAIVKFLVP